MPDCAFGSSQKNGSPGHPQTRGKIERFHQTLKKWLSGQPRAGNQITALFDAPRLLRVAGSASPFVFIWDEDVADTMVQAVLTGRSGIYNVAGDGALTVREGASLMGKRTISVPAPLLAAGLWLGHKLKLTLHGPEQLRFLRYRPVLDNTAVKNEFGFTPSRTSKGPFWSSVPRVRLLRRTRRKARSSSHRWS